jgi:hypothetical protein
MTWPRSKKDVLESSKRVKTGIRAIRGPKNFFEFGKGELASLVGFEDSSKLPRLVDLGEISLSSKALDVAGWVEGSCAGGAAPEAEDAAFGGVGEGEVGSYGQSSWLTQASGGVVWILLFVTWRTGCPFLFF